MTQIAILGDVHWGCRNDLPVFYDHFDVFYTRFIEDLKRLNITDVFQLGDLFDRRKYMNFRTLTESKRILFDRLRDNNINLHVLIGNHDIYLRESTEINSPSLLLQEYNNITIYNNPTTVVIDGTSIDIIPWICKDNEDEVIKFINDSTSDLCFGHFEIQTFSMYKGMEAHDGLSPSIFEKYELVCSGHFHTKSRKGNIVYVGTPYEMVWQDYQDPKGYHIFDTDSRELSFNQNTDTIFVKITYDENNLIDLSSLNLENCFVKVVVVSKTDLYKFDQFMQKLHGKKCFDIKIIEDIAEFMEADIGEQVNLEDTIDVLSHYIDNADVSVDKDKLKTFMKSLYVEAIHLENV